METLTGALGLAYLAALVRLLPIVSFTPAFGAPVVPARMRIGAALVLALPLAPSAAEGTAALLDGGLAMALFREALVGAVLALYLRLVFDVAAAVRAWIDVSRGAQMGQVLDPMSRQMALPLSTLFSTLAVVVFFAVGGPESVLEALRQSYDAVPAGRGMIEGVTGRPVAVVMLKLAADLFAISAQLAAPVIAAILCADAALALANRAAPQVQVFFLSFTAKGVLGLLLASWSLGPLARFLDAACARFVAFAGGVF